MSYKPKSYVESFSEITTFRVPSQISYEIRMVAKQADNEIKNSTPNAKIQDKLLDYEQFMSDAPDDASELDSCQAVIDVLRELIKPEGES